MADITPADLLALQGALTQTVLRDNDRLERNLTERIDELKGDVGELTTKQDAQNGRVNRHEAQLAVIDARLDERAQAAARGFFQSLNKKQKAAVWSIAIGMSGSLMDGVRHAVMFLFALIKKGLQP